MSDRPNGCRSPCPYRNSAGNRCKVRVSSLPHAQKTHSVSSACAVRSVPRNCPRVKLPLATGCRSTSNEVSGLRPVLLIRHPLTNRSVPSNAAVATKISAAKKFVTVSNLIFSIPKPDLALCCKPRLFSHGNIVEPDRNQARLPVPVSRPAEIRCKRDLRTVSMRPACFRTLLRLDIRFVQHGTIRTTVGDWTRSRTSTP